MDPHKKISDTYLSEIIYIVTLLGKSFKIAKINKEYLLMLCTLTSFLFFSYLEILFKFADYVYN